MNTDFLALLERSLSRAYDEHVSALLVVLNEAVAVIHPVRRVTIAESLKLFNEKTFRALVDYVGKIRSVTVSVIEGTETSLTPKEKIDVVVAVKKFFDSSLYIDRYAAYEASVERHLARFGLTIQAAEFRPDLTKSLYAAGTANMVRGGLAALSDDLEIIVQKQRNSAIPASNAPEGKLAQFDELIKMEPNIFGIGINLNYLFRRLMGRRE